MEVTKWLKPSISVSRIGDSASVQAASIPHAELLQSVARRIVDRRVWGFLWPDVKVPREAAPVLSPNGHDFCTFDANTPRAWPDFGDNHANGEAQCVNDPSRGR